MFRTLTLALAIGLTQLAPAIAEAPNLSILVMGEDADKDSVARGNRIFNRVIAAMNEEMNVQGHAVFDETATAMGINTANRVRRRDSELIEVARAIQAPPMDVVVVFSIYASVRESAYSEVRRPDVRIPGRVLNLRTGQQIGSFEVDGLELPPLPVNCEKECLLEEVGDHSAILGAELADALIFKLEGFTGNQDKTVVPSLTAGPTQTAKSNSKGCTGLPTAYVIRFDGFTPDDITALEEYISSYSCFEGTRPVRSSVRTAEYWYETRSDSGRLTRNMRLTLEHMDVKGQVRFSGNTLVVTKVVTR